MAVFPSFLRTCPSFVPYLNLYADISCTAGRGMFTDNNVEAAREFYLKHQDKLLFGSDCGWWSFRMGLKPEFAYIDTLELPEEVENKVLRGNSEKLFPLKNSFKVGIGGHSFFFRPSRPLVRN
ncbi:hypothetical protein DDZ13_03975 [Coraliomargarita sinensis]|uniref:Amidohydrolase-related domain-containing protein n=1 Tax=Coraliomargarita sinensis TaxID=2174842 RepID=A0A317ZM13_9BACT|nr:amidohydrolase family protein [Coraliomargarita sinensis]PXA05273.1 hypothetical protein DDZ13_03975 [Coraliomargarita sinensis]